MVIIGSFVGLFQAAFDLSNLIEVIAELISVAVM
jgi:hypothetical protein